MMNSQNILKMPGRGGASIGDPELEAQVIGAMILCPEKIAEAVILAPGAFQEKRHCDIWKAILEQYQKGGEIGPSSLANQYPHLGVHGGAKMLASLATLGERSLSDFSARVETLRRLHKWRQLSNLAERINDACMRQDKSPDEILSKSSIFCTDALRDGKDTARGKQDVARAALDRAREKTEYATTGINSLDYLMQGGFHHGRMYGLGGLFGIGKTICLGTISENLNRQGHKHLFISLETDPEDIEIRNCARQIGLNAGNLFDADDPEHETFLQGLESYIDQINDHVVYEFMPGASLDEVHRAIIRARHRYGINGFILDYWQLLRGRQKHQTEESHLRDAANLLASICRTEKIWGLVAAQTDQYGQLRLSEGLKIAASLYIRLQREENDEAAYFVTEKSNYTRYADTGRESVPGMIFDMVGPHFRNTESHDITRLGARDGDKIDL